MALLELVADRNNQLHPEETQGKRRRKEEEGFLSSFLQLVVLIIAQVPQQLVCLNIAWNINNPLPILYSSGNYHYNWITRDTAK